jgi:hypothetical protein
VSRRFGIFIVSWAIMLINVALLFTLNVNLGLQLALAFFAGAFFSTGMAVMLIMPLELKSSRR